MLTFYFKLRLRNHGLGVDLYTHVIDWEEYRALMQAFFDADVIDVELLYDNAMLTISGGSILPLIRFYQSADVTGILELKDSATLNLFGGGLHEEVHVACEPWSSVERHGVAAHHQEVNAVRV